MQVIQAAERYTGLARDSADARSLQQYVTERVKRAFYDELDAVLQANPGGLLVGQPEVTTRQEEDLFGLRGDLPITTIRVHATVEPLPTPPEYRLIGGPADGRIVRTHGEREFLVPIMPSYDGASSYLDDLSVMPKPIRAVYERQGDTGMYLYRRTEGR